MASKRPPARATNARRAELMGPMRIVKDCDPDSFTVERSRLLDDHTSTESAAAAMPTNLPEIVVTSTVFRLGFATSSASLVRKAPSGDR